MKRLNDNNEIPRSNDSNKSSDSEMSERLAKINSKIKQICK